MRKVCGQDRRICSLISGVKGLKESTGWQRQGLKTLTFSSDLQHTNHNTIPPTSLKVAEILVQSLINTGFVTLHQGIFRHKGKQAGSNTGYSGGLIHH